MRFEWRVRLLWTNNFKNQNFGDVGIHFDFLNAIAFEILNNIISDAVLLGTLIPSFTWLGRLISAPAT